MHVTLDKTVYSNSDSEARREMEELEPLITSSGNVVTVHMPSERRQVADMNDRVTRKCGCPDHGPIMAMSPSQVARRRSPSTLVEVICN